MILVDANILLYAYDSLAEHHAVARRWWESVLNDQEPVALAPVTVLAFLRIATNPRLRNPMPMRSAVDIVGSWLQQPTVALLEQGPRHWEILSELLLDGQVAGPLVMDAHLAALAIEHGAELYSNDRDFSRFPNLRVRNPLAVKPSSQD